MQKELITDQIRVGAAKVMAETAHVQVNAAALDDLAKSLKDKLVYKQPTEALFFDGGPKTILYHLLLAATSFCYWSEKLVIEYQGAVHGTDDGSLAYAIAWKRAFEVGAPVEDAEWLAAMDGAELAAVLRTKEGEASLFSERLFNVRAVGRILGEYYGGRVENLLSEGKGDAVMMVEVLSRLAPFRDSRSWRGAVYPVLTRAQGFVVELATVFHHRDFGRFINLAALTALAEQRIPQLLAERGALRYATELSGTIERGEVLAEGSEEECSIRAATIVAVDELAARLRADGQETTAAELSLVLRQEAVTSDLKTKFHRTVTTAY